VSVASAANGLARPPRDAADQHHGDEPDPFLAWPDGRINGMFDIAPPAVEWFAENALLANRAHTLVGIGGSSKTRALYHLAEGGVTGRLPWRWAIKRTGSSALFLTEDVVDDVHRMVHALGQHLDADTRRLMVQRCRIFPLASRRAELLARDGPRLYETAVLEWVMGRLALLPDPVVFVGFDPALALSEGDELEQSHQRQLGQLMDRIAIDMNACVVLNAHAAKSLANADQIGSHASRGGGALTDAVRGEFVLRSMNDVEARRFGIAGHVERRRYVQLQATKGNSLRPEAFEPIWLQRGVEGTLAQTELEESGAAAGVLGQREFKALELLKRTAAQGDSTLRFWRAECVTAGVIKAPSESAREKAMERCRDALLEAGLIAPGRTRGSWVPT
jgi:hypothetical protein